jgi:Na+/H+ antiporter NhaC
MSTISRILLILFVVLILGGGMFLATWDIPPPTAHIERVIPDDQLPR